MKEFLKLCDEYYKEYNQDITFLVRYLFIDDAIDFIKNRNGRKIDIIVDETGQDIAKPIYL